MKIDKGIWTLTTMTGPSSEYPGGVDFNSMSRASNGNRVVAFSLGTQGDPNIMVSSDDGETWGDLPSGLPFTPTFNSRIVIFIDENDYLHLIHSSWSYMEYYYYYGTPNTGRTDWSWSAVKGTVAATRHWIGTPSMKAFDWDGDTYVVWGVGESYGPESTRSIQFRVWRHTGGVGGTVSLIQNYEVDWTSSTGGDAAYIEFRTLDGKTVDTAPDIFYHSYGYDQGIYKLTFNGTNWTFGSRFLNDIETPRLSIWNGNDDRYSWCLPSDDKRYAQIKERNLANTTSYLEVSTPQLPQYYFYWCEGAAMDRETGDAVFVGTDSALGGKTLSAVYYDRLLDTWTDPVDILPDEAWDYNLIGCAGQVNSSMGHAYGLATEPQTFDFILRGSLASNDDYMFYLLKYELKGGQGGGFGAFGL